MRVVALSDTHAPRFWKACPPSVAHHLESADLILHAGDVCTPSVLDELSQFAPVRVVRGNNDGADIVAWGAPERAEFDIAGLPVAMVHDSGPKTGRMRRLQSWFPGARLVIFGHSHIPWDESLGDRRIINPGSPTEKRRQPTATIAVLEIDNGTVLRAEIVPVR